MTARTVSALLRERAREIPDQRFVWCGDDTRTFAEMDAAADRVAAGLAALGVARCDRVAVVAGNRIEFVELFFGCARLGAVLVPMNIFLKGDFLSYQLNDSAAETLVADAAGLAAARAVMPSLGTVKRIVALDQTDDAGALGWQAVNGARPADDAFEPAARDLLAILYTSGTTGMPKGCMLSNGWYTHNARFGREMLQYGPGDVLFTPLPLFHAWAQGMVMGALHHRLTAVVEPFFTTQGLIERLIETGATTFAGVGMMALAMLGMPPSDLDAKTSLRAALMMPLPPEQQAAFAERFGATVVAQFYGQTECGAITLSRLDEERVPGSIGKPSPTFEVRLVDDDDADVPTGEIGEIVVRPRFPDAMFLGYWGNPDATLETWRNLWHHTGDYGRADAEGNLYFVDRKKDALRRRGENVSSVEVETAIATHPAIAEAAVHAVPSDLTEDDIKACIVPAPGATLEPEDLFAFFRETLPYFAIPRYVEILPELPRNATLRVMKHLLRARGLTPETWDLEAMGLQVPRDERR